MLLVENSRLEIDNVVLMRAAHGECANLEHLPMSICRAMSIAATFKPTAKLNAAAQPESHALEHHRIRLNQTHFIQMEIVDAPQES